MNVLITGATSGIGRSLVEVYRSEGYQVIACGRSESKLNALKADIADDITCVCFDMTDSKEITNKLSQIGPVNIAILNAGDCEYVENVMQFDGTLFERVINVNLVSLGYVLSAILPNMADYGQIGFMSSSATYLPFPKAQAYGASKAGVNYLAESLAIDLAPHHIDVSLIQPGFIKTPLTDKNDFDMPFLMTSEQAAKRVYFGMLKRKKHIVFPKRFVYLLKLISLLPSALWSRSNKQSIEPSTSLTRDTES